MDTYKLLNDLSVNFPEKPALIYKDQVVNFGDLRSKVFSLACGLSSLAIKKGTKVAIYLPNCPEAVFAFLSSFTLGATVIPLDFMLKNDELISCLSHSETEIIFVLEKRDIDWILIKQQVPSLRKVIVVGESLGYEFEIPMQALMGHDIFTPIPISPTDPALIMYTSGTTGKPKGILLNYRHLDGSPEAMNYFVDLSANDIKLCAIPLSHIGGFVYIQNCIIFGITMILMDRFHPMEFLRNISEHKVTCFHIVPSMYTALLSLKHIEHFDLSSLRWVVVFGAPSSPEILERFHKYCPKAQLLNGWGMTETCPPNTVTPLGSNRIESVGKPAPHCEIKIVDENDQVLPIETIGEVVIRGWIVMQEYYKDHELTAHAKRNGWFHTGDLGRFDDEGYLYIVGRKKEMIKVAGQIVFAPEVENVLYQHEAILEAAVIGVPDDLRGEIVKAFVTLKPQTKLSSEELRNFARQHLANFKVPHIIEFRGELPKNRTGKIDKEALQHIAIN